MKIMDTNMRHTVTSKYSDKFKTRFCFIEDHNWSYSLTHTHFQFSFSITFSLFNVQDTYFVHCFSLLNCLSVRAAFYL